MLPTDYACRHGSMVNAVQNSIMALNRKYAGHHGLGYNEAEMFLIELRKEGYELREVNARLKSAESQATDA